MPGDPEEEEDYWFRPVWEAEDALEPPGTPRTRKTAPEPDLHHPLLEPLARAQEAVARLETGVALASPAVAEGLRARLSYREAAGWLSYAHIWIHPHDLALRDGGLTQYRSLCLVRIVGCRFSDAGLAAMAGVPAGLPAGMSSSDHISLGVIARAVPPERVRQVLAETGKASERERDLPAPVMVYYAIALALYMGSSTREVLRCCWKGCAGYGAPRRSGWCK